MAPVKTKAKNLDMTQGEPARLLVLFAIPMLIGGIFQLMYNMTDTLVVGRFASVDALAAIGATGSTTSLIMMLGQGLTNAVSVVISQAEGAGRQDRMKSCVAHAVYLVLAGSLVLGLASFFGARPFLTLLGTPENIIGRRGLLRADHRRAVHRPSPPITGWPQCCGPSATRKRPCTSSSCAAF